ncbi:hypothetical protein V8F06_008629 [Rhypophila decipiens]
MSAKKYVGSFNNAIDTQSTEKNHHQKRTRREQRAIADPRPQPVPMPPALAARAAEGMGLDDEMEEEEEEEEDYEDYEDYYESEGFRSQPRHDLYLAHVGNFQLRCYILAPSYLVTPSGNWRQQPSQPSRVAHGRLATSYPRGTTLQASSNYTSCSE